MAYSLRPGGDEHQTGTTGFFHDACLLDVNSQESKDLPRTGIWLDEDENFTNAQA